MFRTHPMALVFLLSICCAMTGFSAPTDPAEQVDSLFRPYGLPGAPGASVLVVRDGEVLYKKAFGLAEVEAGRAATTATNYRLASVTKPFTATAILMLVEQGRLSLDTKLTEVFTGFPRYGERISVRHLLSHTSGLIDYEALMPDTTTVPLRDRDVLRLLEGQDSTRFAPGARFRYSNSGYALLALIVERVSGRSFAQFLKAGIFEPLGMAHTVAYEQGISAVANRAYGYTASGSGFERNDQSLTSSVLGDGGVYSSVEDLYRWDQALYTGRLVRRETLAEAFRQGPAESDFEGAGYGFGWYTETYRGRRSVWHYGSTVGFSTAVERFPDEGLTVVVLLNRDGVEAHGLARRVVDLYLGEED